MAEWRTNQKYTNNIQMDYPENKRKQFQAYFRMHVCL